MNKQHKPVGTVWFFTAFMLLGLIATYGETPQLHSVTGYVHHGNGTQVSSGTSVTANATTTGNFVLSQTNGPPGQGGFYGAILNATTGETLIISAFNATMYGRQNETVLANLSVSVVNITLNITRPPEVQTVFSTPGNLTAYNIDTFFNSTINVTSIGGSDSQNCNVSLTITNQTVINLTLGGFVEEIGNISLGSTGNVSYQLRAFAEGASTLLATTACSTDNESFEHLETASVLLTVNQQPPTLHAVQGYVFHLDNTTQVPSGTNVTLNATTTGSFVELETSGPPGHTGFYSGVINALDGENVIIRAENDSYEGTVNITLLANPSVTLINLSLDLIKGTPIVQNVLVEDDSGSPVDEIDLNPGTTKLVNCTGEIEDNEGFADIDNATAVFFDSNISSAGDADDNNHHYSNSSCALFNCAGNTCDTECHFDVYYYAQSNLEDSWTCVITATDQSNFMSTSQDVTSMNQLISLDLPPVIHFGTVSPNTVSDENITNVTNFGNVAIGLSIHGFAVTDGDGLAMNCSDGTNITNGFEKYNLTASNTGTLNLTQFEGLYQNLTDDPVNHTEFDLSFRHNDTDDDGQNETYWRLYIPPSIPIGTSCSGNIVIDAISLV